MNFAKIFKSPSSYNDRFYKYSLYNSIEIILGSILLSFYPVWKYVSIRSFWGIKLDMEPVRMNFRTIGHTKNWFEAYPFLAWNQINKVVLRSVLQKKNNKKNKKQKNIN